MANMYRGRDNLRAAMKQAKKAGGQAAINELMSEKKVLEWDGLNDQYTSLKVKTTILGVLLPYLRNRELTNRLPNIQETTRLVQILAQDMEVLKTSLNAIHARHSNRTGAAADPDALMDILQHAEKYVDWATRFDSVIMPNLERVFDALVTAGANLQAALKAPATDSL